ncbi:hypothetical protein [Paracoccus amoyensis]|uniref:hypothetical protein n=1 Tax=Paracoccus amoyensis TaxID=2760093 RepID=UPI001FE5F0F4|nr:hypothetical protein [Paracoccus amoyensis]
MGIATGELIASYTVVDAHAVKALGIAQVEAVFNSGAIEARFASFIRHYPPSPDFRSNKRDGRRNSFELADREPIR